MTGGDPETCQGQPGCSLITLSPLCHKLVNLNYPTRHTLTMACISSPLVQTKPIVTIVYPFVSPGSLMVLCLMLKAGQRVDKIYESK